MIPRHRLGWLVAAVVTVGLGLTSRASGMPGWVHAYVGDALYAVLITLLLGAAFPTRPILIPAWGVCALIELSQAWHPAWLDTLRANRLVALVLGRGFVWSDLVAYAVGVAVVGAAEAGLRSARRAELVDDADADGPGQPDGRRR